MSKLGACKELAAETLRAEHLSPNVVSQVSKARCSGELDILEGGLGLRSACAKRTREPGGTCVAFYDPAFYLLEVSH